MSFFDSSRLPVTQVVSAGDQVPLFVQDQGVYMSSALATIASYVISTIVPDETIVSSVTQFGAVGDGVTDDTAALQAGSAWLISGDNRRLYFPADRRYRIKATVYIQSIGVKNCSIVMDAPISPDPGIGKGFIISGFRHSEFKLKVSGGGIDADYTQADPVGGDNAFVITGCRHCKWDITGNDYAGRVLNVRAATSPYKTSFNDFRLDTGDRAEVTGASKVGQAVYCLGSTTAFGSFTYLNASWSKYAPYFKDIVDCVISHAEGGTGSNLSSWTFDNCGSIWLGDVLMGDESGTETLMTFKNGCRRININNFFAVQSNIGLLIQDCNSSITGIHINNITGSENKTLMQIDNSNWCSVDCVDSNMDDNSLIISGTSKNIIVSIFGLSNNKETVVISDTASYITIKGISTDASQVGADIYATSKVTSTGVGIIFDNFSSVGSSPSAAFDLVAGNNVIILGGRYTTSPGFLGGVEPIQIRDAQGIKSEGMGTATILSGDTSVTVAHGLFNVPSYVQLTGRHSETSQSFAAVIDDTNIRIDVPSAVTANRTVDWYAIRLGVSP
jgi:hypothetical protein